MDMPASERTSATHASTPRAILAVIVVVCTFSRFMSCLGLLKLFSELVGLSTFIRNVLKITSLELSVLVSLSQLCIERARILRPPPAGVKEKQQNCQLIR